MSYRVDNGRALMTQEKQKELNAMLLLIIFRNIYSSDQWKILKKEIIPRRCMARLKYRKMGQLPIMKESVLPRKGIAVLRWRHIVRIYLHIPKAKELIPQGITKQWYQAHFS